MVKAAILHEGDNNDTNDKMLIRSLLTYLELDLDCIHFVGFGSKSDFFKTDNLKYSLLKQQVEAGQINKILFIVDSDYKENDAKYGGFENTENLLKQTINELGFQYIACFYIVCNPVTKEGYLESLIFASLPDTKRECIERFIKCSEMDKRNHKSIIYGLCKIGYPYSPIPHYNFDHSHFDKLKAELKKLFA